jgi:hypothetical protein
MLGMDTGIYRIKHPMIDIALFDEIREVGRYDKGVLIVEQAIPVSIAHNGPFGVHGKHLLVLRLYDPFAGLLIYKAIEGIFAAWNAGHIGTIEGYVLPVEIFDDDVGAAIVVLLHFCTQLLSLCGAQQWYYGCQKQLYPKQHRSHTYKSRAFPSFIK